MTRCWGKRPFENIDGKGENAGNDFNASHMQMLSIWTSLVTLSQTIIKTQYNLLSAKPFNLDESKILSSGKGLKVAI